MYMRIIIIILVVIAPISFATEQQNTEVRQAEKTKPVEKAPKVRAGNVPQPAITITENKDRTIKEYYIGGKLRAIKVIPKNGLPAYYLIDHKGTGQFISVGPDMGAELEIPQWILFEW